MGSIEKIYTGRVIDKKLALDQRPLFQETVEKLDGHYVFVTIEKIARKRSLEQNAYYHAVIVKMIADEIGWDYERTHNALKEKFLAVPGENGLPDSHRSTTDLSTVEFEEYLENIRQWAFEFLNLVIPLPNEVIYREGYQEE